jgi:hypothetical protein
MSKAAKAFLGTWRIGEMEAWDEDFLDLLGPARITFARGGLGSLRFGALEGELDCRFGERGGEPLVEFSWQGIEEGDSVSGRGWAVLVPSGALTGHIFVHHGDDSAFCAAKAGPGREPDRRQQA